MKETEIKNSVRKGYAKIVQQDSSCCTTASSCCTSGASAREISKNIGYTEEDLQAVPEGSNLGLGCGNPIALASLKEGETVIDLGSGAGFDCFLAAEKVGASGRIIGIDMTPEMIDKARENAEKSDHENVEFRLGEIENLPAADNTADIVISNCVINLVPDKSRVFKEAFRALKPGGRLMVSDIVLTKELPEAVKNSIEAYIGCLSGAAMMREYLETIETAGFQDVKVTGETSIPIEYMANDPTAQALMETLDLTPETVKELGESIRSIIVYGIKPE